MGSEGRPTVWEVLNEYADVRDDMEDALLGFAEMQDELRIAMEDLSEDLEAIRNRLFQCDSIFKRYRAGGGQVI